MSDNNRLKQAQFNTVFPEQEEMDRVDDLNPTSKEDFLGCTYVSKG
ncbi:MAG: hypothetical protein ACJ70M_06770 [Nitrososphaera sp.]